VALTAVRGALGFLTRLPVGTDDRAWDAFRHAPAAFPLAGYVAGALVAAPLVLPLPDPTVAAAFVASVVLVTGVNHFDGLADIGDAAVVHGDRRERREVMHDTSVGVGAVLALGVGLVGLTTAGLALVALPTRPAVGLALAAEVGAKLAMATLVCVGEPSHEGFGAQFLGNADRGDLAVPVLAALPAAVPARIPGLVALLAAVAVALLVRRWAARRLGGVGGDVLGATNELARVAALHAGVVAWTLS